MHIHVVFLSVCGAGSHRLDDYVFSGYRSVAGILCSSDGKHTLDYDIGRSFDYGMAFHKGKKERLLLAMGVGIVLFFLLLLQAKSTPLIVLGIMGFGYSMAGIYPTALSFAGLTIQKYPIGWSFMLTFASVGSIIMPTIIGKIAETAGIFYGMSSIVVVVFVDLICIIGLVHYVRKGSKE